LAIGDPSPRESDLVILTLVAIIPALFSSVISRFLGRLIVPVSDLTLARGDQGANLVLLPTLGRGW
jgi:hypothetical protein